MSKKYLMLSSSLIVLLLAGCGGGGGGGTASSSSTPVPVPSTLQAAGTTKTYDVNSAVGLIQNRQFTLERVDQAGGGSTITATTDASGNLTTMTYNIITPGSTFNQTYQATSPLSPNIFNINTLSQALLSVAAGNVSNGAFISALINPTTTLSYTAYGAWASQNGVTMTAGAISLGVPTAVMPVAGTATYNGTTLGVMTNASGGLAVWGGIQLVANFGTGSVATTISNLQTQVIDTSATGTLSNMTGTATIAGNQYSGTLSGGGLSGTQVGSFYGPGAAETGGTWKVAGGGVTVIGSYGAKQ